MEKPEHEGMKDCQGLKELPLVQRVYHFYRVWKQKLFLRITHPKTKAVFASGNDRAGKVTAMQLPHTLLWMDKGHLSATWGPKRHLKLLLKLNIRAFLLCLCPTGSTRCWFKTQQQLICQAPGSDRPPPVWNGHCQQCKTSSPVCHEGFYLSSSTKCLIPHVSVPNSLLDPPDVHDNIRSPHTALWPWGCRAGL